MSKKLKVTAFSCSPSKKRNSDSMLSAFLAGMSEFPEIDIEKIYLEDVPIDHYSYENSEGAASHEAAFKGILEKMENSSGLVIATPTYNFSVPAGLKNFVDRIRPIALDLKRTNWLRQPVSKLDYLSTYFLVSGGTPRWAQTILFFAFPAFWLRSVFLYYGAKCLGAYYSGDTRTFKNKKVLEKCKKLGRKYAIQILRKSPNGILERIFWRPPQNG